MSETFQVDQTLLKRFGEIRVEIPLRQALVDDEHGISVTHDEPRPMTFTIHPYDVWATFDLDGRPVNVRVTGPYTRTDETTGERFHPEESGASRTVTYSVAPQQGKAFKRIEEMPAWLTDLLAQYGPSITWRSA